MKSSLEYKEQYELEKREDMRQLEHYRLTGVAISHVTVSKWLNKLAEGKVAQRPNKVASA